MPIIDAVQLSDTQVDYLIIGGGTCGLVVATRLSEDPNVVVAVIEAGDYHPDVPEINTPGFAGRTFTNPKFDWIFMSTPQKHANNRVIYQPRGKGLGGSSILNLLVYGRGSKADFDALEALGNKGWGWDDIVKYSKKHERFVPMADEALAKTFRTVPDLKIHGTDGPIVTSFSPWHSPLHNTISESLDRLGIPTNNEPASGINVGMNACTGVIDPVKATRSSAASGYFTPNVARKNLLVVTNALVSKIVMQKEASGEQRAVGVDFVADEKTFKVRGVRKEVILSAGTLQTPALLELSGIGNSKLLRSLGIEPLIDLPSVGENLQDHLITATIMEADPTIDSLDSVLDHEEHIELYKQQKGALASIPTQLFAFLPSSAVESEETIKRWQSEVKNVDNGAVPSLKKQYDILRPWLADPLEAQIEFIAYPKHIVTPVSVAQPGKRYYTLVVTLMHPLSRGSVHITSTDPAAPPAIDPNYFGHPVDLELLTAALRFALKVFKTEPMQSAMVAPVVPSAEIAGDEHALRDYVKNSVAPEFHPLGTAAMLPREDGGVVDAELKVYGTTNLRVVDASILPLELSAHIQSAVYAIGEKAADMIKQAA